MMVGSILQLHNVIWEVSCRRTGLGMVLQRLSKHAQTNPNPVKKLGMCVFYLPNCLYIWDNRQHLLDKTHRNAQRLPGCAVYDVRINALEQKSVVSKSNCYNRWRFPPFCTARLHKVLLLILFYDCCKHGYDAFHKFSDFHDYQKKERKKKKRKKKMTWTRSSWNITRCARGSYLLQLLLELHGPRDDGTPHRVLHALHVGVHAVQGEHLSEARVPIYRILRHVCSVTGVFRRLKDKKKRIKLEECSRVDKRRLTAFTSGSRTKKQRLCLTWCGARLRSDSSLSSPAATPTQPRSCSWLAESCRERRRFLSRQKFELSEDSAQKQNTTSATFGQITAKNRRKLYWRSLFHI